MISLVLSALALLPIVRGLCYSPVMHGFAPDVILPSVVSSDLYCPAPHVFDHFVCMCVDPSVVRVRVPTEGRTSLKLSLLTTNPLTTKTNTPSLPTPHLAGLPDMHLPGQSSPWTPVTAFTLRGGSASGMLAPRRVGSAGGLVVPKLNPYGSFNFPANTKVLAAAKVKMVETLLTRAKRQELIDKMRWQQQLKRDSMAAAAELAAAMSSVPASTDVGGSGLDGFMRDTLRRILNG